MREIWKDIEGYDGDYQISNLGRVRSFKKLNTQFLKPVIRQDGYLKVRLWKNNKTKNHMVHRLVGIYFLPNPKGLKALNHKDENKTNNELWNLEWCTQKQNVEHAWKNGLATPHGFKPVHLYKLTGEYVQTFESIKEASEKTGVHRSNITQVCNGEKRHAKGFIWRFVNEKVIV